MPSKSKSYVFSQITFDASPVTRLQLASMGAEEFYNLPDEVMEQIMFEYGATLALAECFNIERPDVASIANNDPRCWKDAKPDTQKKQYSVEDVAQILAKFARIARMDADLGHTHCREYLRRRKASRIKFVEKLFKQGEEHGK